MQKILIIRNQGIGDLILITPAIRALRQLHPEAHLAILVGEWSRVAVEGNPHLNEIISYPDPWIQNKQPLGYLRLVARLRQKSFNRAYIFHSHPLIHLLAVLAGIPERFGFYDLDLKKKGAYLTARTEWQPNTDRYVADNYLDIPRLAGHSGDDVRLDFYLRPEEQAESDHLLVKQGLEQQPFLVVAPGGGINPRQNVFEKRWGTQKYVALCQALQVEPGWPIVLLGSQHEAEIGGEIQRESNGGIIDLSGKISFRLSAGLIRRSRMLICNDSAVMHVAVAYGIPSLAIFGPSNPRSLLPASPINGWISAGETCSPCYCNSLFPGCDHLRCMTNLSPTAVAQRIQAIVQAESSKISN